MTSGPPSMNELGSLGHPVQREQLVEDDLPHFGPRTWTTMPEEKADGVQQLEVGRVDPLDEPLAAAGEHREEPEVELVHQPVLDERAVELAGAVLQQVAAGLLLERRDALGGVALDDRGVPGRVGQGAEATCLGMAFNLSA